RRVLALASDDVEEVPVLARADHGRPFLVELVESLDRERLEQLLDLRARLDDEAGAGPLVVVAEQLTAEPATGAQRVDDPLPHVGKPVGPHEGKHEARVDEVALRPARVLETGDLR